MRIIFKLIPIIILALSTSIIFSQNDETITSFDIQGHRGARGLQPENTLPAFETALDLGVTTLEFDMHFTADDEVIVWHDDVIPYEKCRLPEGVSESDLGIEADTGLIREETLKISRLTLEQVQAFICDVNPDPAQFPDQSADGTVLAGADYHIPTLAEVFTFVENYAQADEKTDVQRENASQVLFNIETKRKPNDSSAIGDDFDGENAGAFELAILDVIAEFDVLERVILQSFDHRSLWAIKAAEPDITLAALTNRDRPRLSFYADQGVAIWSPRYTELNQALLAEAHELDILVIPWTVNDRDDMQMLIELGVDGIISDFPDRLVDLVDSQSE